MNTRGLFNRMPHRLVALSLFFSVIDSISTSKKEKREGGQKVYVCMCVFYFIYTCVFIWDYSKR